MAHTGQAASASESTVRPNMKDGTFTFGHFPRRALQQKHHVMTLSYPMIGRTSVPVGRRVNAPSHYTIIRRYADCCPTFGRRSPDSVAISKSPEIIGRRKQIISKMLPPPPPPKFSFVFLRPVWEQGPPHRWHAHLNPI